eukprot:1496527-Pyramimonas_sp.AAC.1
MGSDSGIASSARGLRAGWPRCAVQPLGSGVGGRLQARAPAAASRRQPHVPPWLAAGVAGLSQTVGRRLGAVAPSQSWLHRGGVRPGPPSPSCVDRQPGAPLAQQATCEH